MKRKVGALSKRHEPDQRCSICGKTDLSDPSMEFRYCTTCEPSRCYCMEHVKAHEHVVEEEAEDESA